MFCFWAMICLFAACSGGWLHFMTQLVRPGTVRKQVLLQAALGDAQVTPLGAELMARAYSASTIYNQTRPVFGVAETRAENLTAAIVEWR